MKQTTPKAKKPGCPSKYCDTFPPMLFKHMAEGLSFASFGGLPKVKVSNVTLYTWLDVHPEFLKAKQEGEAASRYFWENLGRLGCVGKLPGFNLGAWVFNMKNRFGWRDRQDVELSGRGGGALEIDVTHMSKEQLLTELTELEQKRKAQVA